LTKPCAVSGEAAAAFPSAMLRSPFSAATLASLAASLVAALFFQAPSASAVPHIRIKSLLDMISLLAGVRTGNASDRSCETAGAYHGCFR
jgi:hypothetical protein